MKTKRQRIVDAVVARMKTIRTANGFETDAGRRVEVWQPRFDERELASEPSKVILVVCDLAAPVSKESKHSKGSTCRLPFQVRILRSKGVRDEALRAVIGDVVSALGRDVTQPTLDPILWPEAANVGKYLAVDTEPAEEGFVIPEEAMEIAAGAVAFTVVYATALFDPYQ